MLTFEFVIILIALIGNGFLALFTFLKNPRSHTNILFFVFTVIIATYIIFNSLITGQNTDEMTFFWVKMVMSVAVVINLLFYLLVTAFPKSKLPMSKLHFFIVFSVTFALVVAAQNNLVFSGVVKEESNITSVPGIGMPLFLLHTLGLLGGGFYILIKKLRKSIGKEHEQIKLFLTGAVFLFALILITNVLLPIVFNFSALIWLLPVYTLIFVGFISYAIVRHKFLDVSLIVARSVAYIILLLLITSLYTVTLFLISNLFFKSQLVLYQAIIYAILTLIIAFTFEPLKKLLEEATDELFFKGKYNSNELVLNLTKIMASTLHLEDLTKRTLHQLITTMRITQGEFIIFAKNSKPIILEEGSTGEVLDNEAAKRIFKLKRVVNFDEEENEEIRQIMRKLNVVVAIPLYEGSNDKGLLVLGQKKSGGIYSKQDIEVLEIFGPEVSVAIHNAESYEEISKFNITLKEEVEMATSDLKMANRKLKELDKLKNEFVSVASHELRTPMTAIKSYLWMALEGKGGKLNEKQQYYVQRGYNSVDRLIRLVNDMLNISRIESGKITIIMQSVDLMHLAQEVVDEVLPRAQEVGVHITIADQKKLSPVLADPDKIKEVLFNLIGNSLKFTPKGGKVNINFSERDGMVQTQITDTGVGIPAEDIGKLFQKFGLLPESYTTNQPAMGTGLGLYICRTIVELHQGKIWVTSGGRDKGSTFSFNLKIFNKADAAQFSKNPSGKKEPVGLIHSGI